MAVLRLQLRRDRVQLPVWIVLTSALWLVSAQAIRTEFGSPDTAGRLLDAVIANPGVVAVRGLPDGVRTDQLVFFQVFTFVAILAGLMATFLVTRHARGDEERGRLEVLGATPVGRSTPLRAALVLGVVAEVVLGVGSALAMLLAGFAAGGSWLAGAAVAGVGLAFLGVGALLGQLLPTGRAANSAGVVVVVGAYLVRAVGDALGTPDLTRHTIAAAWPSFVTPIGWAEQVSPFREQRAGWLVALVALGAVAATVALVLQRDRDLGASLVRERPGRATAPRMLRSSAALAWRLHAPAAAAWAVGGGVFGLFAGGLSGAIRDAGAGDAGIQQVLRALASGGSSSLTDTFVVAVAGMAGVLGSAAGVQGVLRLRGEETEGRAEAVLATPVARTRWLLASVAAAAVSGVVVAVAFGVVAAVTFAATLPADARGASSLLAGIAQVPAIAFFTGLTAVAVAVVPRAAAVVGWGALALAYLIGPLGSLLGLDDAVVHLSPFTQTPSVPGPDPQWGGAVVVLVIAVLLGGTAVVAMRRRGLTT
ncbi:ABC transporter permease [Microbacterium sp. M1A1_1b]